MVSQPSAVPAFLSHMRVRRSVPGANPTLPRPACRWTRTETALGPQLFQQCFDLLEVYRVKALGEPAVDFRQQLLGRCPLPLTLPELREAQRSAQLWRLRLLVPGHVQRLPETGFRLAHIGDR